MRFSIQRLRWVLAAGALLLVTVLAVYIGYGRYRALTAYRRILARSGISISRDTNGVTYSQSLGGKKIFTLRAARETSLGNGRWTLHDADLLLYTRDLDHPDHIYGKNFEYDENAGVARALGEVFMDLEAPGALAGPGAPAGKGRSESAPASGQPTSSGGPGASVSPARPAAAGQIIHVHTSGLVYQRKLGVATTDQWVEFRYGGMLCTAVGAEFNTKENILRLLAKVTMDGLAHSRPVHLTAVKADIDRTADIVNLKQPVMNSEGRTATARQAVLDLRKDGSIQQAHATGEVTMSAGTQQVTAERLDATLSPTSVPETARLSGNVLLVDSNVQRPMHGTARQVDATFDPQGAPARLVATGAANLSTIDRRNPAAGAHGLERSIQGEKIVALFKPGPRKSTSQLHEVHADGSGRIQAESLFSPAAASSGRNAPSAAAAPLQLKVAKPVAPQPVAPQPVAFEPVTPEPGPPLFKRLQVAGDDLDILFTATGEKQVQPQHLEATGHTVLQQDAPLGEQEISRGDTLEIAFASSAGVQKAAGGTAKGVHAAPQQPLTVVSAVQAGHVTLFNHAAARTAPVHAGAPANTTGPPAPGGSALGRASASDISTGNAERAVYDGTTRKVTLSGDTELVSGTVSVRAPTVTLDQQTGDAEAHGGVQTDMASAPSSGAQSSNRPPVSGSPVSGSPVSGSPASGAHGTASGSPAPVTHVLSASASFDHQRRLSEFRGTDAQPARMWQDASQVQAAVLLLDGVHHTFSARPASSGALVHAIFAGTPAKGQAGAAPAGSGAAAAGAPDRAPAPAGASRPASTDPAGTRSRPGPPRTAENYVRVASPRLDYNDLQREAVFSGGVQMDGSMGEVRGQRATVFLKPAAGPAPGREAQRGSNAAAGGAVSAGQEPASSASASSTPPGLMSGSLDRVVVSGDVHMEQPGRSGTGEQLLYTAATDSYVLTGSPGHWPRIVDAQQGNVTGSTLRFGVAGSTIVVAGEPGAPKSGHGRVRTETEVRP